MLDFSRYLLPHATAEFRNFTAFTSPPGKILLFE